ncbi:GNAT family N-acetyltransferase [Bacillus sp. NP157]|nr:GNAT family N-acetyltransferase [Bacillus sp. NP157]
MLAVRPYVPADEARWDALVARSRNGTFLHRRAYMDYHAARFSDASLLVEEEGELLAVLPANRDGDTVSSHAGLTYGGMVATPALRAEATLAAFRAVGQHYRGLGVRRLVYKPVPHVFHATAAEEDLYALHRVGASVVRRDLSSMLVPRDRPEMTGMRRRAVARARKACVGTRVGDDIAPFHALLVGTLRRHGVEPTHSAAELALLHDRFPGQIVLHEAHRDGELLAGAIIFDFGHTVHTQYLAASDVGRETGALSLLLAELIGEVYADRARLSFGISTEDEGRVLNPGLVAQKESFGAHAVVHDRYEWLL